MDMDDVYNMVTTYSLNSSFALLWFLELCLTIFNWLFSCASGQLLLYVEEKVSIMSYQRMLP